MTIVLPRPLMALGGVGIALVALSLPAWGAADSGLTAPAGATIVGRVIFLGAVPPPQVVEVTRNPETCGASQSIQRSPGLMKVKCDAHPFMHGFVMVSDYGFVATTDALGRFSIAGVPPGKHEISLWHEMLGTLTKQVTVPPQGELSVTFQYP